MNARSGEGKRDDELNRWEAIVRIAMYANELDAPDVSERAMALGHRLQEDYPEDPACLMAVAGMMLVALVRGLVDDEAAAARKAIDLAEASLALAPNWVRTLDIASQLHRQFGIEAMALPLAERATALHGVPFDSHYSALLQAGRLDDVLALESATGSRTGGLLSGEAQIPDYYKSVAACRQGDLERALQLSRKQAADTPRWATAWVQLANVLMQIGRHEEAEACLEKVHQLQPHWTPALHERGCRRFWRNDEAIVDAMCAGLRLLDDVGNRPR